MSNQSAKVSTEDLVRQDILERKARRRRSDKTARVVLFLAVCAIGVLIILAVLVATVFYYRSASGL